MIWACGSKCPMAHVKFTGMASCAVTFPWKHKDGKKKNTHFSHLIFFFVVATIFLEKKGDLYFVIN